MPGLWLNFSKSGVSVSAGGKGYTVNFGPKGLRETFSIRGTGLSYTSYQSHNPRTLSIDDIPPSKDEVRQLLEARNFYRGLFPWKLHNDQRKTRRLILRRPTSADALFVAAVIDLTTGNNRSAVNLFRQAKARHKELNRYLPESAGVGFETDLRLSGGKVLAIKPDSDGCVLGMAAAMENAGIAKQAIELIEAHLIDSPESPELRAMLDHLMSVTS